MADLIAADMDIIIPTFSYIFVVDVLIDQASYQKSGSSSLLAFP